MAGSQANKEGDQTFNESWRKVMEMDAAERKKKEATQMWMEEEQQLRVREERMRREREEQRQKKLAEGIIKSIHEYDEVIKRAYDRLSNMEVERERERKVRGTGHSSTQGHKEDEDVSNEAWRRVKE
jgi:hypothetical protein